jgi:DNA-binding transcriptional ArsR family regulator
MSTASKPATAAFALVTGGHRADAVLHALSDPVRVEVARQLDREGEATCAALDRGRPKSSMSHHFRVLRDAGIIRTRTDGPARMNELCRAELGQLFPGLLAAVPGTANRGRGNRKGVHHQEGPRPRVKRARQPPA